MQSKYGIYAQFLHKLLYTYALHRYTLRKYNLEHFRFVYSWEALW